MDLRCYDEGLYRRWPLLYTTSTGRTSQRSVERVLITCVLVLNYVSHLSAIQEKTKPVARFPRTHQYDDGTARTQAPAGKRPETPYDFRMKRAHRLGRGKDLNLLFARGRRFHSPFFSITVRARQAADAGPSRFVFVVPKSVDKRAVVRNRLRRRAREYIRRGLQGMPRAADIAITIKKEAAAASRKEFYARLQEILARL